MYGGNKTSGFSRRAAPIYAAFECACTTSGRSLLINFISPRLEKPRAGASEPFCPKFRLNMSYSPEESLSASRPPPDNTVTSFPAFAALESVTTCVSAPPASSEEININIFKQSSCEALSFEPYHLYVVFAAGQADGIFGFDREIDGKLGISVAHVNPGQSARFGVQSSISFTSPETSKGRRRQGNPQALRCRFLYHRGSPYLAVCPRYLYSAHRLRGQKAHLNVAYNGINILSLRRRTARLPLLRLKISCRRFPIRFPPGKRPSDMSLLFPYTEQEVAGWPLRGAGAITFNISINLR